MNKGWGAELQNAGFAPISVPFKLHEQELKTQTILFTRVPLPDLSPLLRPASPAFLFFVNAPRQIEPRNQAKERSHPFIRTQTLSFGKVSSAPHSSAQLFPINHHNLLDLGYI
jgi:hypothetical protein